MTVALCGISAETQHVVLACVHPNHRIVLHILQHRYAIYINHLGSGISLFNEETAKLDPSRSTPTPSRGAAAVTCA